jgi:cell division septation protein DedD
MIATAHFSKFKIFGLGLAAMLSLVSGCTDRGQNPPSVRDGVSVGPPVETPKPTPMSPNYPGPDEGLAPKSPLGEYSYTVLVAVFDNQYDADHLAFQLRMKRINNFVYQYGGEWRVCVGLYPTKARARKTLRLVYDQGFTSAYVLGPGDDGIAKPRE